MSKYRRNYVTTSNYNARKRIFSENYKKVKEHNDNNPNDLYTLELNNFCDWTESEK